MSNSETMSCWEDGGGAGVAVVVVVAPVVGCGMSGVIGVIGVETLGEGGIVVVAEGRDFAVFAAPGR